VSRIDEVLRIIESDTLSAVDKFQTLLPFADEEHHQMIGWVWFNLAIFSLELGDEQSFDRFSSSFCFSDVTSPYHFRAAKIHLLRRRITSFKKSGQDSSREIAELLSLEPTDQDLDVLDEEVRAQSSRNISTFSADEEFPLPLRCEFDRPEPIALTAPHYCIEASRHVPGCTSPTIDVIYNSQYLYYRNESAIVRGGSFYRRLYRSASIQRAQHSMWELCREPVKLPGTAVVLNDLFGPDNYCHWLLDWWPRLILAQQYAGPVDWICTRLGRKPYQLESCELVSGAYKPELLIDEGVRWFSFDRILVVDNGNIAFTHPCWSGNPRVLQLLRAAVLPAANAAPAGSSNRIFISRQDASGRRILNEPDVLEILGRYNFHPLTLTGLTIREQAEIFSQCEAVVGAHGAGLTNLLFMPQGSAVIELFHYRCGTPAYYRIATALGIRYHYMSCDSLPGSNDPYTVAVSHSTDYLNANIWVDTDVLDRTLHDLFSTG
jgi:capsular polysaccharide biosynthesis protein